MTIYGPLIAAQDFTVGASLTGPNIRCERCGRMLSQSTARILDRENLSTVLAGMAGHWLGCGAINNTTETGK